MFSNFKIVLIRTSHPGNIGAVARAMKNMGFANLNLVNPKIFPSEEADSRASGAIDILRHATVTQKLDDVLSDCSLVVGASARNRKLTWPVMNPRDFVSSILSEERKQTEEQAQNPNLLTNVSHNRIAKGKIALLFGEERIGLTNEELQRCHYHVHIPSDPEFSSLNLAMAVQVILYEIRMNALLHWPAPANDSKSIEKQVDHPNIEAVLSPADEGWDEELAQCHEVELFLDHLKQVAEETGFLDPEKPRQMMTRLRRLFQRAHMDKMEVNILRGILASVQKASVQRKK